jgi:hypothetical protein
MKITMINPETNCNEIVKPQAQRRNNFKFNFAMLAFVAVCAWLYANTKSTERAKPTTLPGFDKQKSEIKKFAIDDVVYKLVEGMGLQSTDKPFTYRVTDCGAVFAKDLKQLAMTALTSDLVWKDNVEMTTKLYTALQNDPATKDILPFDFMCQQPFALSSFIADKLSAAQIYRIGEVLAKQQGFVLDESKSYLDAGQTAKNKGIAAEIIGYGPLDQNVVRDFNEQKADFATRVQASKDFFDSLEEIAKLNAQYATRASTETPASVRTRESTETPTYRPRYN